jgi:gliding motility-associated-like protein
MNRINSLLWLFLLGVSALTFAQAPTLTASGNQLYCPLSTIPIITAVNIQNPSSSPISAVYIQISEGYDAQYDRLILTGNHPNISSNWDQNSGKLKVTKSPEAPLNDLINAVYNINFQSNNGKITGERVFSITTGQANYLSSTGHYYEYVADLGISWEDARIAAKQRNYNGLQGYLATLTSIEEAQLCGEQANGAGWIGGTDETTEGIWKWVTGPEGLNGGVVFWNGDASGFTTNFTNWNYNQPDNAHGGDGEDYVHITDPSVGIRGAWNDLRIEGDPKEVWAYHPKGYIVEYGGMPGDPEINISASTRIYSPTITETTNTYICGAGTVTVSAKANAGTIYWFTDPSGGTPIHEGNNYKPIVNSTTDFYVSAGPAGCYEGPRERITVTYYDPINVTKVVALTNCIVIDSPNPSSTFNLEEAIPLISADPSYQFDFFISLADAQTETAELESAIISNATTNTAFVRVSNQTLCYEIVSVNLEVSSSSLPEGFVRVLSACDDDGNLDGKHLFNLSEARTPLLDALPAGQNFSLTFYNSAGDALNSLNPITEEENFFNETPVRQEIFVRIKNENTSECYSIGPYIELFVKEVPDFDLSNLGQICPLKPSYELKPINTSGSYDYQWYDESGNLVSTAPNFTVTIPGRYSVFATSSEGCISKTKEIEIIDSGPADFNLNNINIIATGDTYEIEILNSELLGIGDYEYALDNPTGNYQNEETFYNVPSGNHILYINDKNGCGNSSLKLFLFGIPKYFTPNGDGYNDNWNIKGLSNPQNALIFIYDRYGKLIRKLDPNSKGWDGTFNEKIMPEDDYWFQVNLEEGGIYKGHFSLIRSAQ